MSSLPLSVRSVLNPIIHKLASMRCLERRPTVQARVASGVVKLKMELFVTGCLLKRSND